MCSGELFYEAPVVNIKMLCVLGISKELIGIDSES